MRRAMVLAVALCVPAAVVVGEEPAPPLKLEHTVTLPGVKGRIDHLAALSQDSLYVAALGNGTMEVVDMRGGRACVWSARVPALPEPQGILFFPGSGLGEVAVACGGDGTVRVFDPRKPKELRRTECGADADNLRWDPVAKSVLVGHGDGALSWIDGRTGKIEGTARLDAHPEGFQVEAQGKRVFVNVPGAGHVAVVDREKREVMARWKTGDAAANYPMALDEERKRLFVGCRKPARLLVLDTDSGKVLQSLECVGDADDVFVDAATGRVLVIGGEGFVDVFSRDAAGAYSRTSRTPTAPGARTGLLDGDLLYIAAPAKEGKEAAVLLFRLLPPPPTPK